MSNFWDNDPVAPTAAPKSANFWENDPVADHSTKIGVGEDIAKSAGTGLIKGAIGATTGLIPDISAAAHNVANKYLFDPLLNATIGPPKSTKTISDLVTGADGQQPPDINKMFGSENQVKALESVTGDLHKPQTTAGEYAQTAGEFAPALLGGGEGLMQKLATRVAAPASVSETAGQLTKGTELEPYARVLGAVGGGSLAGVLSRAPGTVVPTVEELKSAARAQYNHPDVKDVRIDPAATDFLHHWIRNDLESGANSGFRASDQPKTFSAIGELSNPDQSMARAAGAPATIDDISSVRKRLGRIASERDATGNPTSDAAAASRAIDHVNTFLENLRQPDLLQGNAARASQVLHEAGQNWGAAKRAEEVATRAENARIQAASTYGGGNINNATRQALRPLAKNDFQKARGFNPDEQAALSSAVEGSWLGNTLRQVGKYGPDTGLKGMQHVGAAYATGGASIPASLAAFASKLGGDAMTRNSVNRLDTMLRERSPLHRENVARTTTPTIQSQVTPGVTLPNPHYVPPRNGPGALPSALVAGALAAQANRLRSSSQQ
jgi:hypothetical protein